jgi:hypothetical protein
MSNANQAFKVRQLLSVLLLLTGTVASPAFAQSLPQAHDDHSDQSAWVQVASSAFVPAPPASDVIDAALAAPVVEKHVSHHGELNGDLHLKGW